MKTLEKIIEQIGSDNELLLADGFDDAVIGIDWNFRIIYSSEMAIRILMFRDGMSRLDAIEFLEFNVLNAHVGDKTPLWMMDSHQRFDRELIVNQLFDEMDEMIQFGNSREISFGRGIETALHRLELKRTPNENTNDDDSIKYMEQR
jgi:hypothetical protein